MISRAEQYLRGAFESLDLVERELMRPNEDAVTLCACQCTRKSACGFLRSYLMSKMQDDFKNDSLADLQYRCAKIDPHFNVIDLSCFDCRNDSVDVYDKNYCLSVEKVSECFEQVKTIRKLVIAKLKLPGKYFR